MFEIQQYFEQYQKFLLLRKMNGFNLIQNYQAYLILSNLALIICVLIPHISLKSHIILYYGTLLIFIQLFIQIVCIKKLENQDIHIIKEL